MVVLYALGIFLSFPALGAPSTPYKDLICEAARQFHIDPKLLQALVKVESNFNPKAKSPKGAMGLGQVMPETAERCYVEQPYHALNNLMGASRCLRKLINLHRGDLVLALAAYNAGEAAVRRYRGIPPYKETQEYVQKVLERYSLLKRSPS